MKTEKALMSLLEWDHRGRYVYAKRDLAKLFQETITPAINSSKRASCKKGRHEIVSDSHLDNSQGNLGQGATNEIATKENTLSQSLSRLVKKGILIRAARDAYVFAKSAHIDGTILEEIAATLRRGEYTFESLESALSQWGRISQIPVNRITLMTTGRRGVYHTPFGTIEFTHTTRPVEEIVANTIVRQGHPLPIASEDYALKNLRSTRRSLDLVIEKG